MFKENKHASMLATSQLYHQSPTAPCCTPHAVGLGVKSPNTINSPVIFYNERTSCRQVPRNLSLTC